MRNYFLVFLLFLFSSCDAQTLFQGYDLSKPSKFLKLPSELDEVSGLQFYNNNNLLAIQDEKGSIYRIKTRTGKIGKKEKFGPKGDYEGVVKAGRTVFVLRSDGTILEVDKDKIIEKYEFKHHKNMDFEGICYNADKNKLLVACKENLHKGSKKEVFIYSFDLKKRKYAKKPFVKIDKKKVHRNFKPSGIAIQDNGNIFVLSSFSKTLLVLDKQGKILDKTQLNEYIFHQPEGITFDTKGRLYISNEKHKTYPTLLRFDQL